MLFNNGTISSPISRETYSYAHNGRERMVTVQSAGAQPTRSGHEGSSDGDEQDESSDGVDGNEDDEDGARTVEPLVPLPGALSAVTVVMLYA